MIWHIWCYSVSNSEEMVDYRSFYLESHKWITARLKEADFAKGCQVKTNPASKHSWILRWVMCFFRVRLCVCLCVHGCTATPKIYILSLLCAHMDT